MKVFSADQIKRWDAFTIREEGISSDALMERAASLSAEWILTHYPQQEFCICCGSGNNGGDGLVIARILFQAKRKLRVICLNSTSGSDDFILNLKRLQKTGCIIEQVTSESELPSINKNTIVIDALFGTGLSKPVDGIAAVLITHINNSGAHVLSIDIPSGMYCDKSSKGLPVMKASKTVSFTSKLAFLVAENEPLTGNVILLDIGLSKKFEETEPCHQSIPDEKDYRQMIKPRPAFSHKGSFGHAALISGSHGMMGASILAAKGYLKSGAGKLTCFVPECGYEIMQTSVPEAICSTSGENHLQKIELPNGYDAIGAGPGIGTEKDVEAVIADLLKSPVPLVLDADALNILSNHKDWIHQIPNHSVITPHPGEFDRLFGKAANDFQRLEMAEEKARALKINIVLKGHYTAVCTPEGKTFFNNSGNAGMAKPGMGDVLTGLLTGMLAQGYTLPEAALLAVHLHGMAGDLAAEQHSQQAMTALDVIENLDKAWKLLNG